jgi:hypothetical protein
MNRRRGKATRRDKGLIAHVRLAEARRVPLTQYCQENGVNVQSMYNLRSLLARKEAGGRQTPAPKRRKPVTPFVAVRVAAPVAPAATACRLQVKGWVIECADLPPPAWLAGLMAGDTHAVP